MVNFVVNEYKLDIVPQGNYPVVYLSQHEDGRDIKFYMLNRGAPLEIPQSGISVFVSGLKANGGYFEHSCEVVDDSVVVMHVETDMTDVSGRGAATLTFTDLDNKKVISAKFIMNVQDGVSDGGIEVPTEAETIFQQLLDEIRSEAAKLDLDMDELDAKIEEFKSDVNADVTDFKEDINADVDSFKSDVNDDIDIINARMDNFLASQTGVSNGERFTITPLYSASTDGSITSYVSLSDDPINYPYLIIQFGIYTTGTGGYKTVDRAIVSGSDFRAATQNSPFICNSLGIFDDASESGTQHYPLRAVQLKMWKYTSGDSMYTAYRARFNTLDWSGMGSQDAYGYSGAGTNFIVKAIYGIKFVDAGTSKDPELADIRVGADGYSYSSAGAAVRSQVSAVNAVLSEYESVFTGDVGESVQNWLDEHPEATTTVQDGSLTEVKFSDALKLKTIKDYVTPQMFGAVGDGVADDTTAIQEAMSSGKDVFLPKGTYLIDGTVAIQNDVVMFGCGFNSILKITGKITTDSVKHNINLHDFTVFASKSNGNAVEIIATNNALADNTLNITGVYFEFDNTVTNSTATMLYLYGVRESMISNCVFFGSNYNYPSGSIGLKAEADSTHLTMNINISGCAFSYLGSAIYLNGSEGNRIYLAGFRIINNTIIGCGYGVRTYYFDTPMISNNMVDYCDYPIYCESSTNITIDNNYIQTAHSGGCLYIINTSSGACDIINIFDNIIHSSNGSTAGSKITDGIVLEGGTSPVILRHVNIKGNFILRVKTAINLANSQFANISNNQVFYATTFVDGNSNSDYVKLFDNYVQTDVPSFCVNKKDTWKITDNQWGSRHTNGTLRGTFGYSVAANSSAEYNVSFNGLGCVFYDVPAVNVYFKDVGTSWQDVFIAITSVSTSGFTVKIVNASGTAHSNVVGWSAILA